MLLTLLILASVLVGYWVSALVPSELRDGERWFLFATALFSLPLFWLVQWWQAAIVMGALLIGWFPALLGLGLLAYTPSLVGAQLLCVLGVLVGTRWRAEKRPFFHLLAAVVILALVLALPQLI